MAYERTIWKNREVERPRTFKKIENPDGTITLVPAEGNIIEPGTPIIAQNMNNIEDGIEDAYDLIGEHLADYVHLPYSIADGANNYTTLINGIASLVEGMSVKVKFTNANTGASTLNINGLGAKSIRKSSGDELSKGDIRAGQILHLVYTGSVFQLLGERGCSIEFATGTAYVDTSTMSFYKYGTSTDTEFESTFLSVSGVGFKPEIVIAISTGSYDDPTPDQISIINTYWKSIVQGIMASHIGNFNFAGNRYSSYGSVYLDTSNGGSFRIPIARTAYANKATWWAFKI
ncbi:hypothetical protein [Clostridium sp. Cult3]|uniref:hypothetical protein n=1 Tax=Clostridium sp. Cult3 TaxID=2079004 RepID=UPI001F358B01|nr:hypothetical protein [Clostridium sp. Cult3]MCF6461505.1 hypothetical protein [Clostridium sp. Cult3]